MLVESVLSLLIREKETEILTGCKFFAEMNITCLTPSVLIDKQVKHRLHLKGLC
jgi:hypothetical protein